MSVEWPESVGDASVMLHRDLEAMARMLDSDSDMNVQGTRIAGLDSESQATSGLIRTALLSTDARCDFSAHGNLSLPFVNHASHSFAILNVRLAFAQCEPQLANRFAFLPLSVNGQRHLDPQNGHLRILLNRVCPECLGILPHRQMLQCECQTCGQCRDSDHASQAVADDLYESVRF